MALSETHRIHLPNLEEKLQIVRDRTRTVPLGYRNGLHLWGEGGIGKRYAVLKEIVRLNQNHVLQNSRLTGRELFDLLMELRSRPFSRRRGRERGGSD